VSDRRSYSEVLRDSDVVAMKKGQENRRSADNYISDPSLPPHRCKQCAEVFFFGYRPGFPPRNSLVNYVIKLQSVLDSNHQSAMKHDDFYKLGW
jgi:hypothetical protein